MSPMIVVQLVLLAAAAGVVLVVCKPKYEFVVRIRDGRPCVERGKVTAGFLSAVRDVCTRQGIETAGIRGVRKNGRVVLTFQDIPESCRQQLRNAWTFEG